MSLRRLYGMCYYIFLRLISRPTRVTTSSATLINNVFTNDFNHSNVSCQRKLVTDVSDHISIFHMSHFQAAFQCTETCINARNFSYRNKQAFQNALDKTDCSEIYSQHNTQVLFHGFTQDSKTCMISIFLFKSVLK